MMLSYLVLLIPKRGSLEHESSLVHFQATTTRITQSGKVQTD